MKSIIGFILLAIVASGLAAPESLPYSIPRIDRIEIDGQLADWQNQGRNIPLFADQLGKRAPASDFTAEFKLGWDASGLLLAFTVTDDAPFENSEITSLWAGDCIEIFLAPAKGATDLNQFLIAPGITDAQPDLRYFVEDRRQTPALTGAALKIVAARTKTQNGYALEVRLPFQNLNLIPEPGLEFALQIYVTDFDQARDPERISLPWYYLTGTHENTDALQRVVLTEARAESFTTQARAWITDLKSLNFVFWEAATAVGQSVSVFSGTEKLASGTLTSREGLVHAHFILPLDSVAGDLFSTFQANRLLAEFERDWLPVEYLELTPYPFEDAIRLYRAQDRKNPPPQNAILFIGSSSIRLWHTLAQDLAPLPLINRGFGGSHAEHAVHFIDEIVLPYRPRTIVFYEGDNDLAAGVSPEAFLAQCRQFAEKVHAALPKTRIYFLSIKPSGLRYPLWPQMQVANRLLQQFAAEHDYLDFIDVSTAMHDSLGQLRADIFMPDRLHLNAKGYEIWTRIVRQKLGLQ